MDIQEYQTYAEFKNTEHGINKWTDKGESRRISSVHVIWSIKLLLWNMSLQMDIQSKQNEKKKERERHERHLKETRGDSKCTWHVSVFLHVLCELPILSFHSSRSNAFVLRTEIVRVVSGFTLITHCSIEKEKWKITVQKLH